MLTNCYTLQVPMMIVDWYYYGKIVVPPLNAVLYNVFSNHAGPELYGVEGYSYYFINLLLNFNLVLVGTLFSIPMLVSIINNEESTFFVL